jgi:hypothetical protein
MNIDVASFIVTDAYILIPVLYVMGLLLKRTPRLPDWLIPWILLALGMTGGFFLSEMQFSGLLQGVLVTGVTVFTHQIYKQTTCKSKSDPPKKSRRSNPIHKR